MFSKEKRPFGSAPDDTTCFRVWGLGFRVSGLGVWGLGFGVWGLGLVVWVLGQRRERVFWGKGGGGEPLQAHPATQRLNLLARVHHLVRLEDRGSGAVLVPRS